MSGAVAWLLVALGLGVVGVRRRSVAVALVTVQALVLAAVGMHVAEEPDDVVAACILALRALALAAVLLLLVARTREPRPVLVGFSPLVRMGLAIALALALAWLVPQLDAVSRDAELAALALIAFGIVTVATQRATLVQVMGVVLVENGLAIAALELSGASSLVIELGLAFDLMLVVAVAAVLHERIFGAFGSGDSSALRSLRD